MENEETDFAVTKQQDYSATVSSSREVAQVQGQIVMAKKFPRSETQALINIETACKRPGLAMIAHYAYPRGGATVRGPSIRLAETIARYWGNLDYGVREVSNEDGESVVEAYCWDLETNVRVKKEFKVKHERKAQSQIKKLDDPRDVYELVANNGARRLRACILEIIPGDIIERAEIICRQTLRDHANKKDTRPLKDRLADMVRAFDALQVKLVHLEKRLGHSIEESSVEEMIDLLDIYNSIKDKQSKREDWFEVSRKEESAALSKAGDAFAKLAENEKK